MYTLNGVFGGAEGTTTKRPEEIEQIPEEQIDVSVVRKKKDLCEDQGECKDLDF